MSQQGDQKQWSQQKVTKTMPGIVEKIITPIIPNEPEKAQIAIEGADHLYREIRVENRLMDEDGKEVALKPGAEVDVKIEADPDATKIANASSPKGAQNAHKHRNGH